MFDAFISYSHAEDKPLANGLQSVIQTLGKPWWRRRTCRLFRDDTSLSATPGLWQSITEALDNSRFMILMASPRAAKSEWVSKEVEYWLANKSTDTLLIALTDGELTWNSVTNDFDERIATPLPKHLKGAFKAEPKWIDLRDYRDLQGVALKRHPDFRSSAADLAAAIQGRPKEDLLSEELLQQRKAVRLASGAALTLAVAAGIAVWQAYEAISARDMARTNEQRAIAQRNRALTTQSRFLVDQARQAEISGDHETSMLLAIEALPDKTSELPERFDRPYLQSAEAQLYSAYQKRQEYAVLSGHEAAIRMMTFMPDGERLLTGSDDGSARIWDLDDRRVVAVLNGHKGGVTRAVFASQKRLMATLSDGGSVRVWNQLTGSLVAELEDQAHAVDDAAFDPAAEQLFVIGHRSLAAWRVSGGEQLWKFQVAGAGTYRANHLRAFIDPDAGRVLTDFNAHDYPGGLVRLWNIETETLIGELAWARTRGQKTHLQVATFSTDGQHLLTLDDSSPRLWSAVSGEFIADIELAAINVETIGFLESSNLIVVVDKEKNRTFYSRKNGRRVDGDRQKDSIPEPDHQIFLSAQDKYANNNRQVLPAACGINNRKQLLYGGDRSSVLTIGDVGRCRFIATTPDGALRLWAPTPARASDPYCAGDREDRAYINWQNSTYLAPADDVRFEPDFWYKKMAGQPGLSRSSGGPYALAVSGDGSTVAASYEREKIMLWTLTDGESGKMLDLVLADEDKFRRTTAIALSKDGEWLVAGFSDGARVIVAKDFENPYQLPATDHRDIILSVAIDDDGKRLASGSSDGRIAVSQLSPKGTTLYLDGPNSRVKSIYFMPDKDQLMAIYDNDLAILWAMSEQRRITERRHSGAVAFDPLNKRFVDTDGRSWCFFETTQALLDNTKRVVPRCLTQSQRKRFFLDPTQLAWCAKSGKWPQ